MKMKVVILILFCLAGLLIGSLMRQYKVDSVLDRRTTIEDVSPDKGCEGGICPPEEKDK